MTLSPEYRAWRTHFLHQRLKLCFYISIPCILTFFSSLNSFKELNSPLLYWLWLYVICVFAVYAYERLQQREFEARRELNLFLYSVSHDLLP